MSSRSPTPLTGCTRFTLRPTAPFDFDTTVFKASYFPSSDNAYQRGRLWFTMRLGADVYGIRLDNAGDADRPRIEAAIFSAAPVPAAALGEIERELRWRLDLDADLAEFLALAARDPLLAPVVERRRGMRIQACQSLYEFLVIATVLQNATVRRTVQMMENLFAACGGRAVFDGRALSHFWEPARLAAVPEDDLRALKVGYRAKTLLRQAAPFAAAEIDEHALRRLDKDGLRRTLLRLYGVGPASVGYILFAVFHRYDALDTVPPWEQKIYSRLIFDAELVPAEAILAEVRRRWGPWRALAVHYLFEDLFWRHREEPQDWLARLIRL